MDNNENPRMTHTSGLRQPSKIPSPGKGLFEMSASANNARAATLMPPPPEPVSLKHKGSACRQPCSASALTIDAYTRSNPLVPGPTPKRKTLAERAGTSSLLAAPTPANSRSMSSGVKGTSLVGARMPAHASSRPPSVASHKSSASSFSSSIGPGGRPPSAMSTYRPQSSIGHARPAQAVSVPTSRPASSMDIHPSEGEKVAAGKRKAWDTKGRLEDMEFLYSELKQKMNGTTVERNGLEEAVEIYKARSVELENMRSQLSATNTSLLVELESTKTRLQSATAALDDERRKHTGEVADIKRLHSDELFSSKRQTEDELSRQARKHQEGINEAKEELGRQSRKHQEELTEARDELNRQSRKHQEEFSELERRLRNELEDAESRRAREVQELKAQGGLERQTLELEMGSKLQQVRSVEAELEQVRGDLKQEKVLGQNLRTHISELQATIVSLESSGRGLKTRIDFLESDCKSQSQCFEDLQQRLEKAEAAAVEAKEKLRTEETLRRKLHNQVQELKGNIRVFCRVRPSLEADPSTGPAKIAYPDAELDSREVEVMGPEEKSSLGNISTKKNAFSFDRVFGPSCQNQDVFEEISQLVQSALDGYNVCIFCYGQTGSGKTHTMSSEDGMIPRAVNQIYDTAKSLEEKGWSYTMEGSFVEVYNENLNDLLGRPEEFDKKKHEIRHDMQKCKTHVSDLTTVELNSPSKVESILRKAMNNRSVAATKANERSSRSHSVFMLRLTGQNKLSGEKSEGTLNLVDLAGSERLSHSGSTGERLKETQNINRSLSCLGDVIGALGQGKEGGHVPYRNSKLTYLLQFSLGGNSKTLMFVMISPLQAHLSETLTSLKFATKVHNTHIGTAKKQSKVRDS